MPLQADRLAAEPRTAMQPRVPDAIPATIESMNWALQSQKWSENDHLPLPTPPPPLRDLSAWNASQAVALKR
jgi:hypothetical protein